MEYLIIALQLVVSLGILNVWLLRREQPSIYRGSDARSLRQEFAAYGLPVAAYYAVGIIKVGLALAIFASIWVAGLLVPAAAGLAALMLGAFVMHLKIKDPLSKSIPSLSVLALCVALILL